MYADSRNMQQAINDGYVERDRSEGWFAGLTEGSFYASFTLVTVICFRWPETRRSQLSEPASWSAADVIAPPAFG